MMRPTKGVHLVVDQTKLSVSQPTYFDTGHNDGRMVFVIPRENKTYFGTTDTDYMGDLKHPTVTQEDVDYLLGIINNEFPTADLTIDDIEASWAGLRPLISENGGSDYNGGDKGILSEESFDNIITAVSKYLDKTITREAVEKTIQSAETTISETSVSSVSRGSSLNQSDSGLITLAGGKITDYRLMAEGAVHLIAEQLNSSFTLIDSSNYQISGGHFDVTYADEKLEELTLFAEEKGLSREDSKYLASLYGTNLETVLSYLSTEVVGLTKKEGASLLYALNHEICLTPVDYLLRRTNYLLFISDQVDRMKEPIINEMAAFYKWSIEEKNQQRQELENVINESKLMKLKEEK